MGRPSRYVMHFVGGPAGSSPVLFHKLRTSPQGLLKVVVVGVWLGVLLRGWGVWRGFGGGWP